MLWWTCQFEIWNLSRRSASFCFFLFFFFFFFFVKLYLENPDSVRQFVGSGSKFLTAHLEISGFARVIMPSIHEREMLGKFCFVLSHSQYLSSLHVPWSISSIYKYNEPMTGFLSHLFSLLLMANNLKISFIIVCDAPITFHTVLSYILVYVQVKG